MTDRVVDITIRIIAKQLPDFAFGAERFGIAASCLFKQIGNDRVFGDVFSDVFLGVVRPHLLLVDVLFKNVTKHIRIDFLVVAVMADRLSARCIDQRNRRAPQTLCRDLDIGILDFNLMLVENPAVQVWDFTEQ